LYEAYTFEYILNSMLDKVSNNVDKREGSVIYDALAPAAAELAQMYSDLEVNLKLCFAGTASGEYLERRTKEMGIARRAATRAIKKGIFEGENGVPLDIAIGSRFSIEGLTYSTIERIEAGQYAMECEALGAEGNRPVGSMIPIEFINGLTKAELIESISIGENEETDSSLLNRYMLRTQKPATSGNVHQYKQWAMEHAGVGGARVYPLWNGAGTVKVAIVDADKQPAAIALVEETANYIEQQRPIGAEVTVVSATGKTIDISSTVILAQGYSLQNVLEEFTKVLKEYFKLIAFEANYVSHAKIGTILLSTTGVLDYTNLSINSSTSNIPLLDEEIPVLGSVSLEV